MQPAAVGQDFRGPRVDRQCRIEQRKGGTRSLIGIMVESHLNEGNQPIPKKISDLRYGVSITDSCIGWETTERMLRWGYEALEKVIPGKVVAA